jgi:murein DD-endopeptidase MepM/ murein hydrolase activator NlpD
MNIYEGMPGFSGLQAEGTSGSSVKTVAKELESVFAYELLKAMGMSENGGLFGDGLGGSTYSTMFGMEMARVMADRGLGLQEMIIEGLNRIEGGVSGKGLQYPEASLNGGRLPVNGRITSGFGMRRHPISGDMRFHKGVDIAAPEGTAITPVIEGNVAFSGEQDGYGKVVIIDHGKGVVTRYAHNSENLANEGDYVSTGSIIAKVGSTGNSTGPHLHFEASVNGRSIDPLDVFKVEA